MRIDLPSTIGARRSSNAWYLPLLAIWLLAACPLSAHPLVLSYVLTVNTNDYSTVQVAIRIRNWEPTFHLAMARQFLGWSDDAPWTNIADLEMTGGTITREENNLWRVNAQGANAEVRYRLRLGDRRLPGHVQRPFLTPTGGMAGDLHTFLYLSEAPQAAAHLELDLPADWSVTRCLPE